MNNWIQLIGRILLAHIFILAGLNKLGAWEATAQYMSAMGVPAALLPLVVVLEIGGGLLLALGLWTRWAAWALAAFTVLAAIIFHTDFGNQVQMIMFMKNLSITGGLLVLSSIERPAISLDARRTGNP
ncbi:MAG: DoxX family protein [Gammaproteobacteria bacterium]|nr:MAG: DoxX family protein [Gammaproteobacteria bacterium]